MNPLSPLPLVGGRLQIDNSMFVEGMCACPRYLEYSFIRRRKPTGEKSSLNFGSAVHMALEYRYLHYGGRQVDDAYNQVVSELLTDFFAEHPIPDGDWRTLNHCKEIINRYNQRYPIEEFNLLEYPTAIPCPYCDALEAKDCPWCGNSRQRKVAVELPFVVPLYIHVTPTGLEIPVDFIGKIDLPHFVDGGLFVGDNKTTSMLGSQFWIEMRMTAQMRGYVWALQKSLGPDTKVSGYMVNGIRTKELPQYAANGGERRTSSGTKSATTWWQESFQRERVNLMPSAVAEWESNTIELCEEFFWHYHRGVFPMKTKWCASYGGCTYLDVCSLQPSDRDRMLASGMFEDNTWTPLQKKQTTKQ